jgi:hypothetical protein
MPVRFFQESVKMGFASEQAGHPVYEDRDFIEIATPGDLNTIIHREATDKDKANYAAMYAQYKAGLEPSAEGTPLESWPRLSKAQVANYKGLGFRTVEHVAEMNDNVVQKVGMGAHGDRTAARAYLASAKDTALAQRQALELERSNQTIADLQRQVSELAARMENQGGAQNETGEQSHRGPGRPRKVA